MSGPCDTPQCAGPGCPAVPAAGRGGAGAAGGEALRWENNFPERRVSVLRCPAQLRGGQGADPQAELPASQPLGLGPRWARLALSQSLAVSDQVGNLGWSWAQAGGIAAPPAILSGKLH